jgi:hypothetical protein
MDNISEFLNSCIWTYAKSYSKTFPHYYTTRIKVNNDKLFEESIKFMRYHSKIKTFNKKQYLYYEHDGFEYWEMGRPLKAIQVLNKAKIDDTKKYRFPEPLINDKEILLKKLIDRDNYLDYLLNKKFRTIEEENEIESLLCSKRRILGGGKNIIDHSSQNVKNYADYIVNYEIIPFI